MVSINNNIPPTAVPGAPTSPGSAVPTEAELLEAASDPGVLQALAALGIAGTSTGGVSKKVGGNKFALSGTLTSQPPPLPSDRAPVTPETQSLYQSMSDDVSTALAGGRPAALTGARQTAPGSTPKSASDALQQLAAMPDAEAQTPEGQAKVVNTVTQGAAAAGLDIGSMGNGAMMAAFMVLQVRNEASGKEVTSVLQDLTSEARKSSIDVQIAENKAAAEKVKEAAALQKKMGFLAPLIEAIMAIVAVVVTVLSGGSATALAAMAIGAVVGFLAGGAAGGAQKGNGFDVGSAFSGMAIGASISGLVAKMVAMIVSKLLLTVGSRVGIQAAEQLATKAQTFNKALTSFSDKPSMAMIATNVSVSAAGTIAKAGMQYSYDMKTADAKEHQARAKMEKAISDMLQTQFQALSTSLQGMLEGHNSAVNQALSMLKTQFGAMQKTVSQING